jgi:hypothetical protein
MLLTEKSDKITIEGHKGTWYVIGNRLLTDEKSTKINYQGYVYLLEHEKYGEDASHLIVKSDGTVVLEDVTNGFEDLETL